MSLLFPNGQLDKKLGIFPVYIMAGDEVVIGLDPLCHAFYNVEGGGVLLEQVGVGQPVHPQSVFRWYTVPPPPAVVKSSRSLKAAKAPQDVLLSDLLVWGLSLGADGIYVADAYEFAHRSKPGITGAPRE